MRNYLTGSVVWLAGPATPIAMALAGLIVARTLGPATYGKVAYFFSTFNLLVLLWNLGLASEVTRKIANSLGRDGLEVAAGTLPPYAIARVWSVAVLAGLGLAAWLFGDAIAAAAAVAAAIASLASFAQALLQGLGRTSVVGGFQLAQAFLYFVLVQAWAKEQAERVFLALFLSYAVPLILAIPLTRVLLQGWGNWWRQSRGQWRAVTWSLGSLYAIILVLAPYSTLAVLALGMSGRLEDAGIFSIGLTIPLMLSVSSGTIVILQYYPHLCRMTGENSRNRQVWIDQFYRAMVGIAIAVVTILLIYPRDVVFLLFTNKYAAAVDPLLSTAAAGGLLTVGQLLLWTLIAARQQEWALVGAVAQLLTLLPFIGWVIARPDEPLWVLGIGHTAAAGASLILWLIGVRGVGLVRQWHVPRLAGAALAAIAIGMLVRQAVPDGAASGFSLFVELAVASVGVAAGTALVLWGGELQAGFRPARGGLARRP